MPFFCGSYGGQGSILKPYQAFQQRCFTHAGMPGNSKNFHINQIIVEQARSWANFPQWQGARDVLA
ncbi:MAG: hypothetical protein WCG50_19400, partial [Rhodoferax sp.]|uniref:hypothetical protein n=1 Tax=Rhodoferax sp. TaxID=50421 RepID=UPI0030162036